jgi:hypothetical protein
LALAVAAGVAALALWKGIGADGGAAESRVGEANPNNRGGAGGAGSEPGARGGPNVTSRTASDAAPTRVEIDRTLTIAGRVVDSQRKAISGAEVTFRTARAPIVGGKLVPPLTTTSNSDGRFVFDEVEIRWIMTTKPPALAADSPTDPRLNAMGSLEIAAPAFATDWRLVPKNPADAPQLDLGEIVMRPACKIRGVCVADDGTPEIDAAVFAVALDESPPTPIIGRSGADGSFVFEGLPPGKYRFDASSSGPKRIPENLGDSKSVPGFSEPEVVEAAPKGEASVKLVIPKMRVFRVRLANSFGRPRDGTVVLRWPATQSWQIAERDRAGAYDFFDPRDAGEAELWVIEGTGLAAHCLVQPRTDGTREILVDDRPRRPVVRVRVVDWDEDIPIERSAHFELRDRDLYARAAKHASEAGRKVGIERNGACDRPLSDAKTRGGGEFEISYLPDGIGAFAIRLVFVGRPPLQTDWMWGTGEDLGPIDIKIPKSSALEGRLVDDKTGEAIEWADVEVFLDDGSRSRSREPLAIARSRDLGRFTFRGLSKANYVVRAKGEYRHAEAKCVVSGPGELTPEVELRAKSNVRGETLFDGK